MKTKEWKIKTTKITDNDKVYRAANLQDIIALVEKLKTVPFDGNLVQANYEIGTEFFSLRFYFPNDLYYYVFVRLELLLDLAEPMTLPKLWIAYAKNIWLPGPVKLTTRDVTIDLSLAEQQYYRELISAITIGKLLEHIKEQIDVVIA